MTGPCVEGRSLGCPLKCQLAVPTLAAGSAFLAKRNPRLPGGGHQPHMRSSVYIDLIEIFELGSIIPLDFEYCIDDPPPDRIAEHVAIFDHGKRRRGRMDSSVPTVVFDHGSGVVRICNIGDRASHEPGAMAATEKVAPPARTQGDGDEAA